MNNILPFFSQIASSEYHRAASDGLYLTSHLLGDFRKCPLLFKKKLSGEIDCAETAALSLGRAIHTLVLEGRTAFDAEYIVSDGPTNPRTGEPFGRNTKAFREWAAAQSKETISGSDFSFMLKLRESVWSNPVARTLLDDGVAEQTIRASYCGEPCQVRPDWFRVDFECRPIVCDLKTTADLTYFESDARRYGYCHQAAFYKRVIETASDGEVSPDMFLIAVEKNEPFRCGVWKLTDGLLQSCALENERAIDELRECRRSNNWPTRTEDLRILDI